MFITTETVLLLTFVIPQPLMTTAYRAVDTTIGGVFALLIYTLWPTWERSQVMPNIATRLEAIRNYFAAVMKAYAQPDAYDTLTIHSRLMESRLARSNAEASVERSLQEPEPHAIDANLAQGLLAAANRIAGHVITLEAYLIDNSERHACPQIAMFAKCIDDALYILASAIRNKQPAPTVPDLDAALQTLKHAAKSNNRTPRQECADLSIVLPEAKRIVHNIDIIHSLLTTETTDTTHWNVFSKK